MTGNVWVKSCTGSITLKNVLELSVLHSFFNQINNKTLTPKKDFFINLMILSIHSRYGVRISEDTGNAFLISKVTYSSSTLLASLSKL